MNKRQYRAVKKQIDKLAQYKLLKEIKAATPEERKDYYSPPYEEYVLGICFDSTYCTSMVTQELNENVFTSPFRLHLFRIFQTQQFTSNGETDEVNNGFDSISTIAIKLCEALRLKNPSIRLLDVKKALKKIRKESMHTGQVFIRDGTALDILMSCCINRHLRLREIKNELLLRNNVRLGLSHTQIYTMAHEKEQDLLRSFVANSTATIKDVANQVYDDTKEFKEFGNQNIVDTGIQKLENNPFLLGDFVGIAARPGVGKTTALIQLALNMSKKRSCLFFSLEMATTGLGDKAVANITNTNSLHISDPKLLEEGELERIANINKELEKNPRMLLVDDTNASIDTNQSAVNIDAIIAKIRLCYLTNNIEVVFIDYIQLIKASGKGNRSEQIAEVSRKLKNIASELGILIVVAIQLKRDSEKRALSKEGNERPISDYIPRMSDIAEGGAIEQDLDTMISLINLYRSGVLVNEFGDSTKDKIQAIITKYKEGKNGMLFNLHYQDYSGLIADKAA